MGSNCRKRERERERETEDNKETHICYAVVENFLAIFLGNKTGIIRRTYHKT